MIHITLSLIKKVMRTAKFLLQKKKIENSVQKLQTN